MISTKGEYKQLDHILITRKGEIPLNTMCKGFSINYDINSVCLYGSMRIVDKTDFINNTDVTGGESLIIQYMIDSKTIVKHNLIVLRVKSDGDERDVSVRSYVIDFISEDHPNFIQSYAMGRSGTTESIAQSFFSEKIKSKKKLISHPTKWNMHFNFNNWTGYNIVDFLSTRAMSMNGNPGYRFFETWDNYNFVSLKDLYDKTPKLKFLKKEESNPNNLSYSVYDKFVITKTGDYDSMVLNLGYSNQGYWFDPFTKKYTPETKKDNTFLVSQTINKNTTNATNKIYRLNYTMAHENMEDPHIHDIVQQRLINDGCISDYTIVIRVNGTPDNKPGEVAILKYKSVARASNSKTDVLQNGSEKWLITKVTDNCGDTWFQDITLQKFN